MKRPSDPGDPAEAGAGRAQDVPSEIAEAFRQPVVLLAPPPGAFTAVRRRARSARRRRAVAFGTALSGCLAAAVFLVPLPGSGSGGGDPGVRPAAPPASVLPSESGDPTTAAPVPSASTRSPVVRPSAPASAPVSEVTACRSAQLKIAFGGSEGAAGSVERALVFVNSGPGPCTLRGFPGVSLVGGASGRQIGEPAERAGSPGAAVVLPRGGSAEALLRIAQAGNYDVKTCAPEKARGLRVYPPDERDALFLPDDTLVGCAATGVTVLSVTAVHGPATP
ncbi:DUF4232 domain-containing protein [Streptomyces sp. NPDC088354]|uniref:DUF4232 domain-containing protein n=1 Tax=unclassified Streptomyces TaxID=2593676 RepID=UPI0029BE2613|nr:DUF4232 domain-containing protein [Streptomyces sp. MI02-7b]MDX3076919.1 DUF4232 domain-containing protein [Streptomyces sp. MI02-7b]